MLKSFQEAAESGSGQVVPSQKFVIFFCVT